jgi:hypothetical protein
MQCCVDGCEKGATYRAEALCAMHYHRRRRLGSFDLGPSREQAAIARFWLKVDKSDADGCWPWTGFRMATGYGYMHFTGRLRGAHVVSLFIETGQWPPPDKPFVLHRCGNPPCVRASHLRFGDYKENALDMIRHGRSTRATVCKRGHRREGANLAGRNCKACAAFTQRQRIARRRIAMGPREGA